MSLQVVDASFDPESARQWCNAVWAGHSGYAALFFGIDGHFNESGRYEFRDVQQVFHRWPEEEEVIVNRCTTPPSFGHVDVYACPLLRTEPSRRKGNAAHYDVLWWDVDAPVSDEVLEGFGFGRAFAVSSGRDGHAHVYLTLDGAQELGPYDRETLCRAMAGGLPGADHKYADNDILRVPGTQSYKVPGGVPVVWRRPFGGAPVHVKRLWDAVNPLETAVEPLKPVVPTPVPRSISQRLSDTNPPDRSAHFHGLVGACKAAGFTHERTVELAEDWVHRAGYAKYFPRVAVEVSRSWGKHYITGGGDGAAKSAQLPRYFNKETGLLAATLSDDILAEGPLATGLDDIMWSYQGGVWVPDRHVVRNRAAQLLGESYRRGHGATAEDVIRSRVPVIACDPVPEFINFRNGLLDWETGALAAHTPELMTTVQLPVEYDSEAACPQFEEFLASVVPEDMVETVWEFIGYLMYSGNPLHKAVMLVGTGRNGKGTFLRAVSALLGETNVTAVSLHELVGARFATVSLFGKLANIAGDIDGTYLESTATFKAVTGQDRISAEHKGHDRFDFTPWAVPVFSANQVPASADATAGYLSRWLIVPFPHDFTGREDRGLAARLNTPGELRGIAARGVRALRVLMGRGDFELSESAVQARDDFVRRVDQVRTWLAECCELGGEEFVNRVELYAAFKEWAHRDGHRPVKAGTFYDRLNAAGITSVKVKGVNGYRGVRVESGTADFRSPLLTSGNGFGGEEGEETPYPPTRGAIKTPSREKYGKSFPPFPPVPPKGGSGGVGDGCAQCHRLKSRYGDHMRCHAHQEVVAV